MKFALFEIYFQLTKLSKKLFYKSNIAHENNNSNRDFILFCNSFHIKS